MILSPLYIYYAGCVMALGFYLVMFLCLRKNFVITKEIETLGGLIMMSTTMIALSWVLPIIMTIWGICILLQMFWNFWVNTIVNKMIVATWNKKI